MLTAAAVHTTIYLNGLGVSILLFALRPDVTQLPSVMADVIMLVLEDGVCHVVILSDIFPVCTGFSLLMVLKLDIAPNPVLFQIQQVLLTAVTAVGSHRFQHIPKRIPVLFQNGSQCVVVRPVATYITVDNKIILYRNLDIVCRL